MRKSLNDRLREAAEALDWSWDESDGMVELETWSPAGEDFVFSVPAKNVADGVREFSRTFDTEEHVAELLEAKRNGLSGVPDVKTLVEDADAIREMLEDLADAMEEARKTRRARR